MAAPELSAQHLVAMGSFVVDALRWASHGSSSDLLLLAPPVFSFQLFIQLASPFSAYFFFCLFLARFSSAPFIAVSWATGALPGAPPSRRPLTTVLRPPLGTVAVCSLSQSAVFYFLYQLVWAPRRKGQGAEERCLHNDSKGWHLFIQPIIPSRFAWTQSQ